MRPTVEEFDETPSVAADPTVVDPPHRDRVETVPAVPAFLPHKDQAGAFERSEVLHDCAPVQPGQLLAELAGGPRLLP